MATQNMQLMCKFYKQCQKQGCNDMNDSTQRSKACAVANDLGLFFNDITQLYNEARECYKAAKKQTEDQKRAKEDEEIVADGKLLLTISDKENFDNHAQILKVYMRADKSIFSVLNNGPKIESSPEVKAIKTGTTLLTYKPSQAVFTSATVGGITTGGVHYTKDGYKVGQGTTGKGEIKVSISGVELVAQKIAMTEYTKEQFRRDKQYHSLVKNGTILCFQKTGMSEIFGDGVGAAAQQGNYQLMVNAASMYSDERRIPFKNCVDIANLIHRIVNGNFPPTEEEIYESALAVSHSTNPNELEHAIQALHSIRGFKDADKHANELQARYDEIIQRKEKETMLKVKKVAKNAKLTFNIITLTTNLIATVIFTLLAVGTWLAEDASIVAAILASISAIISIPGINKLIFREKYGFLQKMIRWGVVIMMAIAALIFLGFQ